MPPAHRSARVARARADLVPPWALQTDVSGIAEDVKSNVLNITTLNPIKDISNLNPLQDSNAPDVSSDASEQGRRRRSQPTAKPNRRRQAATG